MHCVNCGAQNLETTRYCKNCGANLEVLRQALTQGVSTGPLTMIGPKHVGPILILSGFVGVGGLLIVFSCLAALSRTLASQGSELLLFLFFLGLLGITGVCVIVISLLRMLRAPAPPKPTSTGQLLTEVLESVAPPQRALGDFSKPVSSVVEHTTARLGDYAPPDHDTPNRG